MNSYYKIFYIAVFGAAMQVIFPQTIPDLENRLSNLQSVRTAEQSKIDSLGNVLDTRINMIEKEKSKPDFNRETVTGLMSGSITISKEIDKGKNKLKWIDDKIESVKRALSIRYGEKIDSLKALEYSGGFSKDKLSELKSEQLLYIEKKVLVSPKPELLSFHPDELIKIDPGKIKDPEQKKIYTEYLSSALSEVENRIGSIKKSIPEVSNIISLQKKTRRFIEETEFETGIPHKIETGTFSSDNSPTSVTSTNASTGKSAYSSLTQNYILLLYQLSPETGQQFGRSSGNYPKFGNLTYQQYLDLLKELSNRLDEYKLILEHKLGKSK